MTKRTRGITAFIGVLIAWGLLAFCGGYFLGYRSYDGVIHRGVEVGFLCLGIAYGVAIFAGATALIMMGVLNWIERGRDD